MLFVYSWVGGGGSCAPRQEGGPLSEARSSGGVILPSCSASIPSKRFASVSARAAAGLQNSPHKGTVRARPLATAEESSIGGRTSARPAPNLGLRLEAPPAPPHSGNLCTFLPAHASLRRQAVSHSAREQHLRGSNLAPYPVPQRQVPRPVQVPAKA